MNDEITNDISPVKPKTVELPNVIYAIEQGLYDGQFQLIIKAMNERRKARQDAVMAQVREVFGDDATITIPKSYDDKPPIDDNPFVKRARDKPVRATNLSQDEIDRIDGMLSGPYKTNPDDNNTYRVEKDHGNGMLEITDIFGGHSHAIPKLEWDEWEDEVRSSLSENEPIYEPVIDQTKQNSQALVDKNSNPVEQHMILHGGVDNVPPELRGPIIGGMTAADMGN